MKLRTKKWVAFRTIAIGISLAACGSKKDSSEESATIPDGEYDSAGPTCFSTGSRPVYPSPEYATALLDFHDLTRRHWTIKGTDLTINLADADCAVTILRKIHTNRSGFFALTQEKTHSFAPENCEFAAVGGGQTLPASRILAVEFQDVARTAPDILLKADDFTGKIRLTSLPEEPTRGVWAKYGCADPDALTFSLSK